MTLATAISGAVTRWGRDVTVRQVSHEAGSFDPATDVYTPPGTPSEAVVKALSLGYADKLIDGDLRRQGDRRLIVATTDAVIGFTPKVGDTVVDDSVTWTIVDVAKRVKPGGTEVAQVWQVRR